jgi:hypothetical protein
MPNNEYILNKVLNSLWSLFNNKFHNICCRMGSRRLLINKGLMNLMPRMASLCPSVACNNSRIAERIFMKFDIQLY